MEEVEIQRDDVLAREKSSIRSTRMALGALPNWTLEK